MTLIIGILSKGYVALASDRRLTWYQDGPGGRKIIKQGDSDTKAFLLAGCFLMGYTGLARVRDTTMEEWVAHQLAGIEPNAYFETLAEEMTGLFRAEGMRLIQNSV